MSHLSVSELLASLPGVHTEDVPTGSDSEAANSYFLWLYENYFLRNPNAVGGDRFNPFTPGAPAQWDGVFWGGPFLQIYSLAAVMIIGVAVFARYLNQVHRKRVAYRLSRYDAVVERHGRFGPFSIIITGATVAWALYYPISHVVTGQIY